MWLYACGTQHCTFLTGENELVFGDERPDETNLIAWPLPPGDYRAFLLREGRFPYEPLAVTMKFSVLGRGNSCDGSTDDYAATDSNGGFSPAVSSDSGCYMFEQSISVEFLNPGPLEFDWIGVYRSENFDVDNPGRARLWLYACGNQHCSRTVDAGNVMFGPNYPVESGRSAWPLEPGYYIVVLLRGRNEVRHVGNEFTVMDPYEQCFGNSLPQPVAAPIYAPTFNRPVQPPASDPVYVPHYSPVFVPVHVAPSRVPGSGAGRPDVQTDKFCYTVGETVATVFTNPDPKDIDWVGIYDAHIENYEIQNPLMWLWLCGDQFECTGEVPYGTLYFGAGAPEESASLSWPLPPGEYAVLLVTGDNNTPYYVKSFGNDFTVAEYC